MASPFLLATLSAWVVYIIKPPFLENGTGGVSCSCSFFYFAYDRISREKLSYSREVIASSQVLGPLQENAIQREFEAFWRVL